MAGMIMPILGAGIGFAIGGPIGGAQGARLGAMWGFSIGGLVGGYLNKPSSAGYLSNVGGIQFSTAQKGQPVPVLYGKHRISGTIIWYGNFRSHGSGGKGDKSSKTPTQSTYTASLAVALSEGPIKPSLRVWSNADEILLAGGQTKAWETSYQHPVISPPFGSYALHTGAMGQAAESYFTTYANPGETAGITYPGIAYVLFEDWALGMTTALPALNFEVARGLNELIAANPKLPLALRSYPETPDGDMNPVVCIADFLTCDRYGMGLPLERIDEESFDAVADWCRREGIYVSPYLDQAQDGSAHVEAMLSLFDGIITHSQGRIRLIARSARQRVASLNLPVEYSRPPDATHPDWNPDQPNMVTVPNEDWRHVRLRHLLADIKPKASCWQAAGGVDHWWFHDRERGVMLDLDRSQDAPRMIPLLPSALSISSSSASSTDASYPVSNAFDGNPATEWRPQGPNDSKSAQWLEAVFASALDVDSLQIRYSETASGVSQDQGYAKAIRIRPAAHHATAHAAATICGGLITTLSAHGVNRVYVEVVDDNGSWFASGDSSFQPFGSDGADFLATFLPLATAAGIQTYASIRYMRNRSIIQTLKAWMEDVRGQPIGDGSWGCPNKPYGIHGATLKSWFSNAIGTLHGYSGIAGIDLAEPQWGPDEGGGACWCSSCQAAFAAAHPGHIFGETSDSQAADTPTPSVTTWEQWRGDVLTAALKMHVSIFQGSGPKASITMPVSADLRRGSISGSLWTLKLNGVDLSAILTGGSVPEEMVGVFEWQRLAAESKDYATFCPEWTEYAARWWNDVVYARATPLISLGGWASTAGDGGEFDYGYAHTMATDELQRSLEGAMNGGALNLDCAYLDSMTAQSLWSGWDDAFAGQVWNSVLGEVQTWDGATWRPSGRRAWFRTRAALHNPPSAEAIDWTIDISNAGSMGGTYPGWGQGGIGPSFGTTVFNDIATYYWFMIAGFRFLSLPIPSGSTITAAKIRFQGNAGTVEDPFEAIICIENSDSAAALNPAGAYSQIYQNRAPTTANWYVPLWTPGNNYDSPDLSAVLQQVIDRGGWVEGNDVAFAIYFSTMVHPHTQLQRNITDAQLVVSYIPPSDVGALENPYLAHFPRTSTAQVRVLFHPAPNGDRCIRVQSLAIWQQALPSDSLYYGGLDYDNYNAGGLCLVKWVPSPPPQNWGEMHGKPGTQTLLQIDPATGLQLASYALDSGIGKVNDIAFSSAHLFILAEDQTWLVSSVSMYRYDPPPTLGTVAKTAMSGVVGIVGALGLAYDPNGPYLVATRKPVSGGVQFYWFDPPTLTEATQQAALDNYWFNPDAIAWANQGRDLFLCDASGYWYLVRRASKVSDGALPSAESDAVAWQGLTYIDVDMHFEQALDIPDTSEQTVALLKALVFDDAGNSVGAPDIDIYAGTAENPTAWTYVGRLAYEGTGTIRLASLALSNCPPLQKIRWHIGPTRNWTMVMELMAVQVLDTGDVLTAANYVLGGAPNVSRQGVIDTKNSIRIDCVLRKNWVPNLYGLDSNNNPQGGWTYYQPATAERTDDQSIAASGRREDQHSFPAITTASVADKLVSKFLRDASRPLRAVSLTLGPEAALLEPGDVREWQDDKFGIERLVLRVISIRETTDGQLQVSFVEEPV